VNADITVAPLESLQMVWLFPLTMQSSWKQSELAEAGRSSCPHQALQGFSPAVERFWKSRVTIHQAGGQKLMAGVLRLQSFGSALSAGFVPKGFKPPVLNQNSGLLFYSLTRSDQDLDRIQQH